MTAWSRERPSKAGWTRNAPTKEGWYWWKYTGEPSVVKVVRSMYGLVIDGHVGLVSCMNANWLGPITPTDRQQGRVAGAQDVLESFKKHHDACNDFRHCECAGGFWYEHIGKAWMDEKAAQAAQDEKGVGE